MNRTMLPNGLEIVEINRHETTFVYREIFVDRVYERHAIALPPGAVVFDVGANIGLFALWAAETFVRPKLWCFEPAPHCREALAQNVARLGDDATVVGAALGAGPGETALTYYPHNTIMSSLVADLERDRRAVEASLRAEYEERAGEPLDDRFLPAMIARKLADGVTVSCPVTTVSAMIDTHRIERIGLLKIDVECAESLVLDGIEARHWDRIDHLVIEVHDQGGDEPRKMRERLEAQGFDAELGRAPILAQSDIWELTASRRQAGGGR